MKFSAILISSLIGLVSAAPSIDYDGGHGHGIPVPGYDANLQFLGQHVDLHKIPTKVIRITKTVAVKVPVPYPVKVAHNVPFPVHVTKPYPVPVPQFIKVSQPAPVPAKAPISHDYGSGPVSQDYGTGAGAGLVSQDYATGPQEQEHDGYGQEQDAYQGYGQGQDDYQGYGQAQDDYQGHGGSDYSESQTNAVHEPVTIQQSQQIAQYSYTAPGYGHGQVAQKRSFSDDKPSSYRTLFLQLPSGGYSSQIVHPQVVQLLKNN